LAAHHGRKMFRCGESGGVNYPNDRCAPDAAQRAVLHGVVRCRAGALTSTILSSCAGLTRASISLQKNLAKKMDGRVKPTAVRFRI
jgi:hypothetical protein